MPHGWPTKCLMKQATKEWKSLKAAFKTILRCSEASQRMPVPSMGGKTKSPGQNEAS